jgi:hypothetical protein
MRIRSFKHPCSRVISSAGDSNGPATSDRLVGRRRQLWMHPHDVNQLIASSALESEPSGQLNLAPRADCAEYSSGIIGEIPGCILENGVPISPRVRELCVLLGTAKFG